MAAERDLLELNKRWEKADAQWKQTSKAYQEAVAQYRYSPDDNLWKQVLALRDSDTAAFEEAETAWNDMVTITRRVLNPK
jgi:hypothetical protein